MVFHYRNRKKTKTSCLHLPLSALIPCTQKTANMWISSFPSHILGLSIAVLPFCFVHSENWNRSMVWWQLHSPVWRPLGVPYNSDPVSQFMDYVLYLIYLSSCLLLFLWILTFMFQVTLQLKQVAMGSYRNINDYNDEF